MPPHSCNGKRVLIVEDNEATRETLSLILRSGGFDVATADNGRSALDMLRVHERPSVILLDLMMPVMDGWQFRAEQRRDERIADIPVVVCTASEASRAHDDTLRAAAYLTKPIEIAELLDAIRRFC